uniref:H-2 class II histocompatibility antigen, E-S beta chain-like n=1 Tax=Poecilia latipinna TaxID=48699 RepID=A0A3B3VN46_9TELE
MDPSALGWLLVIITINSLNDIQYIWSNYYNKLEYARFDSNVGKFVGYTAAGVRQAEIWNKDQSEIARTKAMKETYCQYNIGNWYPNMLTKSVEPTVRLYSRTPPAGHHPSMLVCRVYDFYPKTIKVRWLRDGQEVTSDVTTTDEMEDGDWYYQVHSTLEYTPRISRNRIITTKTTTEPLVTDWDPSMPDSERNKLAIGASGLILGLILSLAGFIYYKRKARGQNQSEPEPIRTRIEPVLNPVPVPGSDPVHCFSSRSYSGSNQLSPDGGSGSPCFLLNWTI